MKSKNTTIIAGMAVLALLLMGSVPVLAQTTTTSTTTSTTSTTSTTTTAQATQQSQTDKATVLIQLAQAAQTYAQQVLAIAQKQGANVTKGQSLITQGDQLLVQAQSEIATNATKASLDALGAMKAFKSAAESLQSAVVISVTIQNQVKNLQTELLKVQNRTTQLQTTITGLCSSKNASATVCSDANSNLAKAKADTTSAASLLAAITSSSTETQIQSIVSLLNDAKTNLVQVATDVNTLTTALKDEKGIQFVQTVVSPNLSKLQQQVQSAKLNSSQLQKLQGQLTQASGLLTSAVKSFQAGNFDTGSQQVNQAQQLMALVRLELLQDAAH